MGTDLDLPESGWESPVGARVGSSLPPGQGR